MMILRVWKKGGKEKKLPEVSYNPSPQSIKVIMRNFLKDPGAIILEIKKEKGPAVPFWRRVSIKSIA